MLQSWQMNIPFERSAQFNRNRNRITHSPLTSTAIHEHAVLKQPASSCQRLAQPNVVAIFCGDPGPLPHRWHTSSWSSAGISSVHDKNSVGRFLRIAWTRSQSRRPAETTPMQENTLTTTDNQQRIHRNQKAQTSESKIGELGIRTNFCTPNIAATTSRPPYSEANLVANILTVGVRTTMRLNAGRVPSTRIQVGRVNEQVCNQGPWATNSNAVPKATHTHIESRTHSSLPLELTDIPISSHQTRRANDLHNQALRLSHGDDHGPKPIWWHTSSRFLKKKQHWSFHVQPTRGSLGQVRDRSSARRTQSETCLAHLEIGARCNSCGFTQPEAQQHFTE